MENMAVPAKDWYVVQTKKFYVEQIRQVYTGCVLSYKRKN